MSPQAHYSGCHGNAPNEVKHYKLKVRHDKCTVNHYKWMSVVDDRNNRLFTDNDTDKDNDQATQSHRAIIVCGQFKVFCHSVASQREHSAEIKTQLTN